MKERIIKNWISTGLGALVGLSGIGLLFLEKLNVWECIPIWVLSWALITAKDSLLEGLTAGILKIKQ